MVIRTTTARKMSPQAGFLEGSSPIRGQFVLPSFSLCVTTNRRTPDTLPERIRSMPPANIATAADYADAMMIARRAKNTLFFFLLLFLLFQLSIFFAARFTDKIIPDAPTPSMADTLAPTTRPTGVATTQPILSVQGRTLTTSALWYFTAGVDFLGIVLIVVLATVLLLIVKIMLVGRLIGVAQVTSAFCWCVLLTLLLFPWQAFLQNSDFTGDFKIPGVLYTWGELTHPTKGAKFVTAGADIWVTVLWWARFVGWPVVALIVLLMVQAKSSRGLRAALGESELETPGDLTV